MKYINIFILFFFSGIVGAFAQLKPESVTEFKKSEDSLIRYVDSMNRGAISEERIDYCHLFIKEFGHVLKKDNSFLYPFEELSKKVHILYPEDKSFRIFNWPVEYAPARFRYYGVVQKMDGTLFPLIDQSEKIDDAQKNILLTNKNWFGQEYYRIISEKNENGNTIYFIFGVNHSRDNTSIKMMDVLNFKGNELTFGAPYFLKGQNRFVMEYQKGTQVSLNYDAGQKMVVFNVLESEINQPQRKNTLVPNGDLDGLKWNVNRWELVRNLIPVIKLQDGQAPINGVIQTGK
ncbi:MAG TPA: hypothetical protein PKX92_05965 [Edaphocola sp.]|nr:hypothetical protein [Edaphocola sp.]